MAALHSKVATTQDLTSDAGLKAAFQAFQVPAPQIIMKSPVSTIIRTLDDSFVNSTSIASVIQRFIS